MRDIDTKIGAAYQATLVDVNGDGKLDILATNHEEKPENNGMFAYEVCPLFFFLSMKKVT